MVERGHRSQEQGLHCRKCAGSGRGVMLWALGCEEGVSWGYEAREAGAESPLLHTIVLGRRVQAVQAH